MRIFALLLVSACTNDPSGRAAPKVVKIETETQTNGTPSVERVELSYRGDRLDTIVTPTGTAKLTYGANGIALVEYVDLAGDRATEQLTYENGRLVQVRYEVTGVFVEDKTVTYGDKHPTEITTTRIDAGQQPTVDVVRLAYDADGKCTSIVGPTSHRELSYTPEDRLERITMFVNTAPVETHAYRYDGDRLAQVVDIDDNRFEIAYDDDGRIREVHRLAGLTTSTTRYTYTDGSVLGWTFTPAVPGGVYFDLAGTSYASVSMLQGSFDVGDIPAQ